MPGGSVGYYGRTTDARNAALAYWHGVEALSAPPVHPPYQYTVYDTYKFLCLVAVQQRIYFSPPSVEIETDAESHEQKGDSMTTAIEPRRA
jgi:hypothetical protein